jgi:hypothetical protein
MEAVSIEPTGSWAPSGAGDTPPRRPVTPDRFSSVVGDRRGSRRKDEPEQPSSGVARTLDRWWFDAEGNPRDGGSLMDLRRWLAYCDERGCTTLEVWFERPAANAAGRWVMEAWRFPGGGATRVQRVLRPVELDWLEQTWPSHLWSRVSSECWRGELR